MLLAQLNSSGTIVYVHSDQVNNPQKITNSSRTTVWDQIIEPFGEVFSTPTTTTPTNWRFPGQYADSENSLSYNGARDYDKTLGRYIQADLLGLNAGPNLYAYAGQNPIQRTDFYGLVDLNLIDPGSKEYQMQQEYNDPRYFTVGAHGQGGRFAFLNPMSVWGYSLITRGSYSQDFVNTSGRPNADDNLSVQDVGDRILASGWNSKYGPHKPILLSVCNAASGNNRSFAAQLAAYLANATNAPVAVLGAPGIFELWEPTGSTSSAPSPATSQSLVPAFGWATHQ
jgi:RHS repeat-associated protein